MTKQLIHRLSITLRGEEIVAFNAKLYKWRHRASGRVIKVYLDRCPNPKAIGDYHTQYYNPVF